MAAAIGRCHEGISLHGAGCCLHRFDNVGDSIEAGMHDRPRKRGRHNRRSERESPAGTTTAVSKAGVTAAVSEAGACAAVSQPVAVPQDIPWPMELEAAIINLALGGRRKQLRPLLMVTAFSGLGSQSRMWRDTGLDFRELAAADPKEHAKQFVKRNECMAEHHFDDIRSLIRGGRAPCFVHGHDCEVPQERADFFAGGFACQPTSSRRASRSRIRAEDHPLFETARLTVEYHLARKPRMSLLEQTMGALQEDVFDGSTQI